MSKTISPKITALTFGVLVISFLVVFYAVAWQEPTSAPPGDNVSAPLNVGPEGQAKEGGLILNIGGAVTGLIVDQGETQLGGDLDVDGSISGSNYPPDFCNTGSSIRIINSDGTVTCEPDDDTYPTGLTCTTRNISYPINWGETGDWLCTQSGEVCTFGMDQYGNPFMCGQCSGAVGGCSYRCCKLGW